MIKKVICLGVVLVMCLGLFIGCNSGVWYKVAYNGQSGFGFNEDQELDLSGAILVNCLNELKSLCDELSYSAFVESSEDYSSETSQKIREYDGAFFEEKALIVHAFWGNQSIKISHVRVDEENLIVNLGRKKGAFNDIAITWLFIIEIKKADIEGVTTVQVYKK